MRKYEVMIIIDPTVEERQVDSLMEKYLKVITDEKGTVDNVRVGQASSRLRHSEEVGRHLRRRQRDLRARDHPGVGSSSRHRREDYAH